MYGSSLCRVASRIAIVLLALPCMVLGADQSSAPDLTGKVITEKHEEYFAKTPQLADPLRPLAHLPVGKVRVRAMVATIPDPVETRLGRSFDMALSATLSAFQSQRYVLDGYAFPWKRTIPPKPDAKEEPKKDDSRLYRKMPGVLVFRRESWRDPDRWRPTHSKEKIPADYAIVFLVGESPTYGIQEDAFLVAARCAANFNQPAGIHIDKPCNVLAREEDVKPRQKLDVIGPSFSGSMQSLAIAIRALRGATLRVPVDALVVSASATVSSNSRIDELMLRSPTDANPIEFVRMAWSLEAQSDALRAHLCGLRGASDVRKVIVLAEESTFGRGAEDQFSGAKYPCTPQEGSGEISIDVRTFPPDIASIRAEHSILRDAAEGEVPGLQKSRGRLLELDMKTAAEAIDRPTIYEPSLSSRSDELMLFRMFDNLRLFVKPNVVVILATDVRDRLFLLSHVRQSLPAALPVMMELDFLAIHPDYRRISRGAVFVPAGDSMVCIEKHKLRLIPCQWWQPQAGKGKIAAAAQAGRASLRTYSFATDYAANVFRAVSLLLRYREPAGAKSGSFDKFAGNELKGASRVAPCLYVATLAGFQELRNSGEPVRSVTCRSTVEDKAVPRSSMAAAEARLVAQVPAYVALAVLSAYFMVVAGWVGLDPGQGRVFLSTMHYAVLDGGWLRRLRDRSLAWLHVVGNRLFPRLRQRTRKTLLNAATPLSRSVVNRWLRPRSVAFLMLVLFVLAGFTLGLSLLRLSEVVRNGDAALAHGRDGHALFAIWVLYLCICIVAFARLRVAGIRMGTYAHQFVKAIARPDPYRVPTVAFLLPVTMTMIVMLVMFRQDIFIARNIRFWNTPLSVDPAWPWLFAYLVLAFGVAFAYNVARQFRAFSRMTLFVSSAGPGIRTWLGEKDWPAPQVLHQTPQTPFNLRLQRTCDMKALSYEAPSIWGRTTCNLVDKAVEMKGGARLDALRFERWQTQMVAELKLHTVAIRTCVWCAMLAPIAVLMGMSVYPPVFEPRLTMLAIVQLVGTFGYAVYLVLRMEQDAMLGPMYTRNGDHLSIGGSLRALWPKFLAMAVVLLPLVVPDIWRWLLGIVRSINSFT